MFHFHDPPEHFFFMVIFIYVKRLCLLSMYNPKVHTNPIVQFESEINNTIQYNSTIDLFPCLTIGSSTFLARLAMVMGHLDGHPDSLFLYALSQSFIWRDVTSTDDFVRQLEQEFSLSAYLLLCSLNIVFFLKML